MNAAVTNSDYATDFLQYLVDKPSRHTTLIICSTREDFLRQITPTILAPQLQEVPPSQDSLGEDETTSEPLPHRLLNPTLQLLARSRTIKLVYCPSIDTFRAYLASYVTPTMDEDSGGAGSSQQPLLAILDLVLLHHATSEFSVQGLMRVFASAVETAHRNGMDLMLCECKDIHDETNPARGPRIWDTDVQLLSSSVRLGTGGSSFVGRTISVRRVAERWFSFGQQGHNRVRRDEVLI